MSIESLSSRGRRMVNTEMRIDIEVSMDAASNIYHPTANPNGAFPLSIAENRLNWKAIKNKFRQISVDTDIPDWVLGYTSPIGDLELREAVASFYEKYFCKSKVDPELIACSPGATGIIEVTSFLLAESNDVIALPAPAYPVYRLDMDNIPQVKRHDIITHHHIRELGHGPLLNLEDLDHTKSELESQNKRFRCLLITTPDNPTGQIYSKTHLNELTDWCIANKVHLIVNEIYALSLIDISQATISDDYHNPEPYTSFIEIMAERKSEYLHHWYSFSKDFGISGFRVGIVHTHNEEFVKAYNNVNLSHSVSNHTQWLIAEMIKDSAFMDNYIHENQKTLTASYIEVVDTLKALNIDYVASRGGLFIWVDLSQYISEQTKEAELSFWSDLYENTGVLFTPGIGFGHKGFGLYRIVYPYLSKENLIEAMKRFSSFIYMR